MITMELQRQREETSQGTVRLGKMIMSVFVCPVKCSAFSICIFYIGEKYKHFSVHATHGSNSRGSKIEIWVI